MRDGRRQLSESGKVEEGLLWCVQTNREFRSFQVEQVGVIVCSLGLASSQCLR